jgi:hypothetical protein
VVIPGKRVSQEQSPPRTGLRPRDGRLRRGTAQNRYTHCKFMLRLVAEVVSCSHVQTSWLLKFLEHCYPTYSRHHRTPPRPPWAGAATLVAETPSFTPFSHLLGNCLILHGKSLATGNRFALTRPKAKATFLHCPLRCPAENSHRCTYGKRQRLWAYALTCGEAWFNSA